MTKKEELWIGKSYWCRLIFGSKKEIIEALISGTSQYPEIFKPEIIRELKKNKKDGVEILEYITTCWGGEYVFTPVSEWLRGLPIGTDNSECEKDFMLYLHYKAVNNC